MILGICGFIGSGKDTVADHLVNLHQYRRESYAGTLKDAVAAIFGWDREMLEGKSKEARDWREEVDKWWAERLDMPNLTPRWVLQYWGTEVARQSFHDDIWIASLENKIKDTTDNVVISDCRFPNELSTIKKHGGKIVWVQRGDLPVWYEAGVAASRGDELAKEELKILNVHQSEWAWLDYNFDHVIDNNSDMISLYNQIEQILEISN